MAWRVVQYLHTIHMYSSILTCGCANIRVKLDFDPSKVTKGPRGGTSSTSRQPKRKVRLDIQIQEELVINSTNCTEVSYVCTYV